MYQDDVFHLYEKNNSYCSPCLPLTIGEQDIPCRFQVKTYIKIGHECSVCLEGIIHKTNAYLTRCGHAFHKTCLTNVFKSKWETNPFSEIKCPLCRAGLGFPDLFVRYSTIFWQIDNQLDKLENFWITKDCLIPDMCERGKHYLGMNNNCQMCLQYRETGQTNFNSEAGNY
jgi:hypothetical protein